MIELLVWATLIPLIVVMLGASKRDSHRTDGGFAPQPSPAEQKIGAHAQNEGR